MRYIARPKLVSRLKAFAIALDKAFRGRTFPLNNRVLPLSEIIAGWVEYEEQVAAVAAAYTAWIDAIAKLRALENTKVLPIVRAMERMLRGMFGNRNPQLALFGIKPLRPKKRSAKARGTTGTKRRR